MNDPRMSARRLVRQSPARRLSRESSKPRGTRISRAGDVASERGPPSSWLRRVEGTSFGHQPQKFLGFEQACHDGPHQRHEQPGHVQGDHQVEVRLAPSPMTAGHGDREQRQRSDHEARRISDQPVKPFDGVGLAARSTSAERLRSLRHARALLVPPSGAASNQSHLGWGLSGGIWQTAALASRGRHSCLRPPPPCRSRAPALAVQPHRCRGSPRSVR